MSETKRGYLKARDFYVCVSPDAPDVIYTMPGPNRPVEAESDFTRMDSGRYLIHMLKANVELTLGPDGKLSTRPAGVHDDWQQFDGGTNPTSGRDVLGALVPEFV